MSRIAIVITFILAVILGWCAFVDSAEPNQPTPACQRQHEQLLYPCVRVRTETAGGSGTVVYSKGEHTYVLTNHHVVESAIKVTKKWDSLLGRYADTEERKVVLVETFKYRDWSVLDRRESFDAEIVAYSKDEDLALLRLRTERPLKYVAKLMPRSTAEDVYLFCDVFAVGCSLGHPPIASSGKITSMNDRIANRVFWMTTAQIIFGNSGGAVYLADGRLIGVPSRVPVVGWGNPVTHMGYAIPIPRVYQWAEREKLSFLYDPKADPMKCMVARKKLRERDKAVQKAKERK